MVYPVLARHFIRPLGDVVLRTNIMKYLEPARGDTVVVIGAASATARSEAEGRDKAFP